MKLDRDLTRQWINLIAIAAAFAMNILTNIAPLNGLNLGQISNTFFSNVLIIPANYAFAIWGLIYLGLLSLAVYQFLPIHKTSDYLRRMGYFIVIASVAQIIWVILFQYQLFGFSVLAMLVILASLITLYLRLDIFLKPVSLQVKWLVNFPISIYLAWISVATIVNIASYLYYIGWNGWGISGTVWTMIMMVIGTVLATIMNFQRKDVAFVGVFVWAYIAIALRHFDTPIIALTAGGLALLLLSSIFLPKQIYSQA